MIACHFWQHFCMLILYVANRKEQVTSRPRLMLCGKGGSFTEASDALTAGLTLTANAQLFCSAHNLAKLATSSDRSMTMSPCQQEPGVRAITATGFLCPQVWAFVGPACSSDSHSKYASQLQSQQKCLHCSDWGRAMS